MVAVTMREVGALDRSRFRNHGPRNVSILPSL